MKMINTLKEGERINGVYFCKSRTAATTKNGKEYLSITLQDRTGFLDGKVWNTTNPGVREDYEAYDYVLVNGEVVSFNGSLQLNIAGIRKADEGTYDEVDYMPTSAYDIEEMYTELLGFVDSVKNPHLHQLLDAFFRKDTAFVTEFKRHSAAKKVHHGFVGGLLEHTLSVTRICAFLADTYSYLDHDLLVSAAMFHDIGKVYELSGFPENDYTDGGQLLGHIVMGSEMLSNAAAKIEGFPIVLLRQLKHCILAHHGEFEYGSPKKPALAEALALHYADDMDAKLETFKEALDSPAGQAGEWLGFNKMLDSNIRKTIV